MDIASSSQKDKSQTWWKEAIVYQIYPRSFQDSNNDGIGDLKGITSRLDYIKSLGVDVVWLNPIFSSPNDDNGYDISDYRNIMADFGTMDDFDELLAGMHARGIRMVLDLVVNHSSDEHEWFRQSRSSRTNPYRNYYHWWPSENGLPPKRYSIFDVNNDAWKYDELTDSCYLHYFSVKQPDLNWENPELRKEVYGMMRFWLDKGIDGFRMDVISFISKDIDFPDLGFESEQQYLQYYANGPHLHFYLQEMNKEVLSQYNILTVAEGAGVKREDALNFVDPGRHELNMLYHFEGTDLRNSTVENEIPDPRFDLPAFKKIYSGWDNLYSEKGWGTIYLGNHDQPRMVSRWGNDSPGFRELSSKMLSTFLLTMRATPYYYAGDELGMANVRFNNIEDYKDIATINKYRKLEMTGGDLSAFLEEMKEMSRDNSRTPMQWDASDNAGFSNVNPWLKVNPDYQSVNAASQDKDPKSVLNYFRQLVLLRKKHKALIYGKYELLDKDNPKVYAYSREWGNEKLLVLLNFSRSESPIQLNPKWKNSSLLISNYYNDPSPDALRPFEAVIYQMK
ncbi:MAG: alpha-glucosidase [Bacteroidetes bacterium]|nr:alpha-glucosidase [Bacteroidota bacterium]